MTGHRRETGGMLLVLVTLGTFLLSGTAALASPQYEMDCTSCHNMPPYDSPGTGPKAGKKDPATGAVPGNHAGHSSSAAGSCARCHGDAVATYGNSHMNKVIELSDTLGYSRKQTGVFLNQTSALPNPMGTCSATSCHSDGKGHIRVTPAWGNMSPATCDTCHDSQPGSSSHPAHITYFGGNASCVKCHSDHAAEMGNTFAHASSSRAIDVRFTTAPSTGGTFGSNQCASLYCHSNGQSAGAARFVTAAWGGGPVTCVSCHGDAVTTGAGALSAKHAPHVNNASVLGTNYGCVDCHAGIVSDNATIADKALHVDGSVTVFGANVGDIVGGSCSTSYCHSDGKGTMKPISWTGAAIGCNGCHGSVSSVAGEPTYTTGGAGDLRANSHGKHVTSAADCVDCHSKTTVTGTSIIAGSQHTDGFNNYTSGNGKTFGKLAGKNCSNISCHSGGGRVKSVKTAQWGATLGCNGCHEAASLATGAHAAHVGTRSYTCETCHYDTATGSTVIKNSALHINYSTNVRLASGQYNPNLTCSTNACHGASLPAWNVPATGGCGTCHAVTSPLINSGAHTAHYTGVQYGPGLAKDVASCQVCHIYTVSSAPIHVNGQVELVNGFARNGLCSPCHNQATNWAAPAVTCESCHTTGTLSVIGGITAPPEDVAGTVGHGRAGIDLGCVACHDKTSAHINGSLGDKRLLAGLTGSADAACDYCHKDSGSARKMQNHVGNATTCDACHNVHGTANSNMVLSSFGGIAVGFNGTNLVNNQGTGVCQICHTNTTYYKKNVQELNHEPTNPDCLGCHLHNSVNGIAFGANGACDACHGYPPAPRNVAAGTFGVQGAWSSARFEDYSGGGGAHVVAGHIRKDVKPTDGWAPCLSCHIDGETAHRKTTPMRSHIENVSVKVDAQYRFSNDSFVAYTGAKFVSGANQTGSCFNVSCHYVPSTRWSTEK